VEAEDIMTGFLLGFLIGGIVGACLGFIVLALCVAARNGDAHLDAIDRLQAIVAGLEAENARLTAQSRQSDKAVIEVGANIRRLTDQAARDRQKIPEVQRDLGAARAEVEAAIRWAHLNATHFHYQKQQRTIRYDDPDEAVARYRAAHPPEPDVATVNQFLDCLPMLKTDAGDPDPRDTPVCVWAMDCEDGSWDTECGQKHVFESGTPQSNRHTYCPYCGQVLNTLDAGPEPEDEDG
jgi:hypothetical protein